MYGSIRLALLALVIVLAAAQAPAALLQQTANTMGGPTALRALKTQVIESEGKQFDSSSTPQPLGPTRQITTFRYIRQVEVHPLPTSHADDLVVVYLPKERLLIEADHISPHDGQVRPGPRVKEFVQELDKLKLDVATIVGIHGDQASLEAARAAAKK